jgi:hypothetical protein
MMTYRLMEIAILTYEMMPQSIKYSYNRFQTVMASVRNSKDNTILVIRLYIAHIPGFHSLLIPRESKKKTKKRDRQGSNSREKNVDISAAVSGPGVYAPLRPIIYAPLHPWCGPSLILP